MNSSKLCFYYCPFLKILVSVTRKKNRHLTNELQLDPLTQAQEDEHNDVTVESHLSPLNPARNDRNASSAIQFNIRFSESKEHT